MINVGSIAGKFNVISEDDSIYIECKGIRPQPIPTYAYDVSKAAVHFLTAKLASELSSHHITINAIAPGMTLYKKIKR